MSEGGWVPIQEGRVTFPMGGGGNIFTCDLTSNGKGRSKGLLLLSAPILLRTFFKGSKVKTLTAAASF